MAMPKDPSRICTARRTNGQPCGKVAIRGGNVCMNHGGAAPQVRARAMERLERLVNPALDELEKLLVIADKDSVRLAAIQDVLNRTGYKPPEQVSISQDPIVIRTITAVVPDE